MSDIIQEIQFLKGGLNSDDSITSLPSGDSHYRLGIMVGDNANTGALTLLRGNERIAYARLLNLSHVYFCLGSYYNDLTRSLYFFIFSLPYDSGGGVYLYDNRLLRLNEDTLTIDEIFLDRHNYFGLDPKHYLTDVKMLGTWLFFNPVTDQPKMIDVDMAYNYTNYPAWDNSDASLFAIYGDKFTWRGGLFVANQSISAGEDPSTQTTKWDRIGDSYQDESTIRVTEFDRAFFTIKIPPTDTIVSAYDTDTNVNSNNIKGKVFRFCHRYQYFDNSFSVCSAHSDISLPLNDEVYNGEVASTSVAYNYIKLTFSLYSAALIKNIEIFFQEIGGDWKRLAIINRRDQTLLATVNYTYNFYNNEAYPVIDQTIPYDIYSSVPRKVKTQEIINKNVLAFGGCTEGFDNIDKDLIRVTLTPTLQEIVTNYDISTTKRDNVPTDISQGSGIIEINTGSVYIYWTKIEISTWFLGASLATGDIYSVIMDGKNNSVQLGASDVDTAAHLASAMSLLFPYAEITTSPSVYIKVLSYYKSPSITQSLFYTPTATSALVTKRGGFKTGAHHPFCIFYYDEALRRGDAQLDSNMTVYLPGFNETEGVVTAVNNKYSIDWSVSHQPPSWAKYWRFGYAGNRRCEYFVQYVIKGIATSLPAPDGEDSHYVAGTVEVDITPLQEIRTTTDSTWNCFPNSIIPQYQFTEGDRIRFLTKETNVAQLGAVIDGTYDFEITKFDETNMLLYVQTFDFSTPQIGKNSLVEIYTPIKNNSSLTQDKTLTYYEFGDIMPILIDADGDIVHGGQSQDQDLSASPLPAKGRFDYGDVYHLKRTPSQPLSSSSVQKTIGDFHESMWWSDFYNSNDWGRGKLGLESVVGEKEYNIIRYSDVYLQNTQINGLSSFRVNNYKEINDTYGRIIAIIEIGDTLKVYQERKPSSILIGRTEYQDTSGKGNVVVSTSVLGAIRYSNTNYGTIFPESISKNNRYVYGFDVYNAMFWRDSANGMFPISGRYVDAGGDSDYKMMTYFKSKAKALLASGVEHCRVLTSWDEEYKMLFVNFQDGVNEINNDTVVFHEPSNRWITFTEFEYTPASSYGQLLEPSFIIVKGFETGLGYSFDPDTRFHVFDIGKSPYHPPRGTTKNQKIILTNTYRMFLEANMPTITSSPYINPSVIDLTTDTYDASVFISYVQLPYTTLYWNANWYGTGNKEFLIVTVVGSSSCTITKVPNWLTVGSNALGDLKVGDSVANGDTIYLYPTVENLGGEKVDTFIVKDVYNNNHIVTTTQYAYVAQPIVTISVFTTDAQEQAGELSPITLSQGWSAVAYIGLTQINTRFTVNHSQLSYGDQFSLYYYVAVNGVLNPPAVTPYITVRNQIEEVNRIFYLEEAATVGEQIVIYISANKIENPPPPPPPPPPIVINANISASYGQMLWYIPYVYPSITNLSLSISTVNFQWDDSGIADAVAVTITATNHDYIAIELPIPEWVRMYNTTLSDYVYRGYNGDTLYFVPSQNDGLERWYGVTFRGVKDGILTNDTAMVMVTQYAGTIGTQLQVEFIADPIHAYGSDPAGIITVGSISSTVITGSTEINATFVFSDSSLLYGTRIDLDYYVIQRINGSDFVVGYGILRDVCNQCVYSTIISMSAVAEDGAAIIVHLSENVIN